MPLSLSSNVREVGLFESRDGLILKQALKYLAKIYVYFNFLLLVRNYYSFSISWFGSL